MVIRISNLLDDMLSSELVGKSIIKTSKVKKIDQPKENHDKKYYKKDLDSSFVIASRLDIDTSVNYDSETENGYDSTDERYMSPMANKKGSTSKLVARKVSVPPSPSKAFVNQTKKVKISLNESPRRPFSPKPNKYKSNESHFTNEFNEISPGKTRNNPSSIETQEILLFIFLSLTRFLAYDSAKVLTFIIN